MLCGKCGGGILILRHRNLSSVYSDFSVSVVRSSKYESFFFLIYFTDVHKHLTNIHVNTLHFHYYKTYQTVYTDILRFWTKLTVVSFIIKVAISCGRKTTDCLEEKKK